MITGPEKSSVPTRQAVLPLPTVCRLANVVYGKLWIEVRVITTHGETRFQQFRALWIALWAAHLCAVIGGSLLPGDMLPPLPNDKVLHFGAYLVVALIPVACARRLRTGLVLAALGPVLGALLEIAQAFVPGRSPELGDAVANSAGALVGALAGILIRGAWMPMPWRKES